MANKNLTNNLELKTHFDVSELPEVHPLIEVYGAEVKVLDKLIGQAEEEREAFIAKNGSRERPVWR